MDDARKKLRVCLICVVAAAIVFGIIYYFNDIKARGGISEGTLVMQEDGSMGEADVMQETGSVDGFDSMNGLEGRG